MLQLGADKAELLSRCSPAEPLDLELLAADNKELLWMLRDAMDEADRAHTMARLKHDWMGRVIFEFLAIARRQSADAQQEAEMELGGRAPACSHCRVAFVSGGLQATEALSHELCVAIVGRPWAHCEAASHKAGEPRPPAAENRSAASHVRGW